MENETFYCDGQTEITDPTTWGASTGPGDGGGGYFGVKRIGMTVGNPRKVPENTQP